MPDTTAEAHPPPPTAAMAGEDQSLAAEPAVELVVSPRRRWRHRLLSYLVTVFVLVTLNFFLPRAMPGDPIAAMAASGQSGAALTDEQRDAFARNYGLDQPLMVQYGRYLGNLVQADLGVSIQRNRPVRSLIAERLPWTVLLGLTAYAVATVVGVVAGVHSGWRRGRRADPLLLTVFSGLRSIPPYFLAPLAVFVFAVTLGWFPLSGARDAFPTSDGLLVAVLDVAHHLVLPAATMAVLFSPGPYLLMRAGMVSEAGADHLLLGRAKGLSEHRLKYRYAARNALLPVVTHAAVDLGATVSAGLVFVETAFAYPGMGRLLFESASARDYPTLQGCFLVVTLTVVTLNFLADSLYGRLDPRTRQ